MNARPYSAETVCAVCHPRALPAEATPQERAEWLKEHNERCARTGERVYRRIT